MFGRSLNSRLGTLDEQLPLMDFDNNDDFDLRQTLGGGRGSSVSSRLGASRG